ncbi:hypothetical protein ACFLUP_03130 [Chloroflexota bacterium]
MKRLLIGVTAFSSAAFLISLLIFTADTVGLKWAAAAGALGIAVAGLAFYSYLLASRTDTIMKEIQTSLSQIKELQEEIQKEQKEQGEKQSSGPPIVAGLQAVSQYYMDYFTKQKEDSGEKS